MPDDSSWAKLKNYLKTKLLCFNGQWDNGEGVGWTPGMENVLHLTLVVDMSKSQGAVHFRCISFLLIHYVFKTNV